MLPILTVCNVLKARIPDSARQPPMDAISALGVAGDILTITEFSTALLSAIEVSKVASSLEGKDEASVPDDLRKSMLALSDTCASLRRRLPTSLSPPLKHEPALLELASSCLEDSRVLLEAIESAPKDFRRNGQSWDKTLRAWEGSKLAGRFSLEKLDQRAQAITRHASSILR